MKRFNCLLMPLMVVFVFVLCSCQSDKDVSGPVRVKDVALKASLSGAESRTTMTDTYGGAFAETWNKDVLSIYHSYQSNGTAQSLTPLDFATTVTDASTGTFACSGALTDYTYNPDKPLYAFNKLTGAGKSAPSLTGVAATPISLSLTGWANQDGTLTGTQNAALYDAMEGYATTNAAGIPGALTMKHLGGILNFHLSCSDFTDGAAISNMAFTAYGSDGTTPLNFFPSSATASIASDGTCKFIASSFVSSWNPSGSFVPASKTIDVYLSSFPFSSIAGGSLAISASDANNSYWGVLPIINFSLSSNKVRWVPYTLAKFPVSTTYSSNCNWSSSVTVNCPSSNDISWYLSAQYYWDDGNQWARGGNTTNYTLANGKKTRVGMWFRKLLKMPGYPSGVCGSSISRAVALSGMTSSQISALNLSADYFFLPAAGCKSIYTGDFVNGGTYGYYWSSTSTSSSSSIPPFANHLEFFSTGADLGDTDRTFGFCLWQAQ